MIETGSSFSFSAEALEVGFARPLTKANDFQRNRAIETLLPGAKYHALTAATDFFQQFVIAQFSEKLGGASCFLVMRRRHGITHKLVRVAGVIRLRRSSLRSCFGGVGGYGGQVATGVRT